MPIVSNFPSGVGLPEGGTQGQILTVGAGGDAVWQNAPDYDDQYLAMDGGGTAEMGSTLGAGPYTVEFTEEAEEGSGLPEGGTAGQVLTKTADGEEWADPTGMTETEGDARYLKLSGGTMTGGIGFQGTENPATVAKVVPGNGGSTFLEFELDGEKKGEWRGDELFFRGLVANEVGVVTEDNGSYAGFSTTETNLPGFLYQQSDDSSTIMIVGDQTFIFGLPTPEADNQAVPKSYVDSKDPKSYIVTLSSSSWSSSGTIYQQTVNAAGVTVDTPVIQVGPSLSTTDADANSTIIEAWGKICKLEITQGAGTLTFRSPESLTVNVPVKVGIC